MRRRRRRCEEEVEEKVRRMREERRKWRMMIDEGEMDVVLFPFTQSDLSTHTIWLCDTKF